jgi:hypothetical protein
MQRYRIHVCVVFAAQSRIVSCIASGHISIQAKSRIWSRSNLPLTSMLESQGWRLRHLATLRCTPVCTHRGSTFRSVLYTLHTTSRRRDPTIDNDRLPSDVLCFVGDEEHHSIGNVPRITHMSHGHLRVPRRPENIIVATSVA